MFIKLLHGLHNVINAIVSYIQKWSDDEVPPGTKTLHNFKDGLGKRPAVPLDETITTSKIENVNIGENFSYKNENIEVSNNIYRVKLHQELDNGIDNLYSKESISNVVCVPNPIIFEIVNEVPDKIEKIVPVKTQALPGQDYIFEIFYVKDYSYIEGDILPVFGSWGTYARLSTNGRYLTVNSNADLTVRLILTPAPQDWIPEKPDEGAIQQPGDRQLNTIPRDGSRYDYTIEQSSLEYYFYLIKIENKVQDLIVNEELKDGNNIKLDSTEHNVQIPVVFNHGYDENSIYWKCYDDPKGPDPAQGSYVQQDFNEDYEPIPDSTFRKAQYIYTNGYCYIDTGYKLKSGDKIKIYAKLEEYTSNSYIPLFGCRNTTSYGTTITSEAYAGFVRYYGYRQFTFERNNQVSRSSTLNYEQMYGDLYAYISDGTSFETQKLDGTTIIRQTVAVQNDIDTDLNCYLFTTNVMGNPYDCGARGYIYRVEIFDKNDNIIKRFIPAYNTKSKIYCLYDMVSNEAFYNKRNGNSFSGELFYCWQENKQSSDKNVNIYFENNNEPDFNVDIELPTGYEKIYGIYSKESRLDTGYKIKKNDRVECIASVDNNTSSSYRCLFGARSSSFSDDNYFFFTRFNGSNIACYGKNAQETRGTTMTYDMPCTFITESNRLSCYNINGNLNWEVNVTGNAVDCRYNCWLGCGNNSNSVDSWCYAKIYSFKIFNENDELIMYLVPARRTSDNVLGFYDTITNTFKERTAGNYSYEEVKKDTREKRILHIENIYKDIDIGFINNPSFDDSFRLENCEPIDCIKPSFEIYQSSLEYYFYVISYDNKASDYVSFNTTYLTPLVGEDTSFILTYNTGYDNYDITGHTDSVADIEIGRTLYITYNELDVPAEYTIVPGLSNNNSSTYFNTGYIPAGEDSVVCYASISTNYPTYPCYLFGARNAVGNKSHVFYAHMSSNANYNRMGYDRCCGETLVRDIINNELLKITTTMKGCEVDFAYTKTEIETNPPTHRSFDYQDYNSDVVLPNNYTKMSCIMKRQNSKAYIDLNTKIKTNYKVDTVIYTKGTNTNSSIVLFGSTNKNSGVSIAEHTSSTFTYPMRYDTDQNYWVNTNQNKHSTNSELEFKMKIACSLVLNVTQSSERNYDYLIIQKNGVQVTTTYGLDGSRTIELQNLAVDDIIKIYYKKDGSANSGTDTATVQILYENNIVDENFITSAHTNTNSLYTKYGGSNIIALKQENLTTNNNFIYNDTAKIKINGSKVSWWNFNDELVGEMTYGSSSEEPLYDTYLFGLNENDTYHHYEGNADLYIYSFKLYDNEDNLIYHLVPAQNKTSKEYGLYDVVTDTFFTNVGEDYFEGHEIEDIHNTVDDCEYEMYLFGCNQANSRQYCAYGTIYKFTIYNRKNKAVVNLVPVKRNSDNVLGFYDTVRKIFIIPAAGVVTQAQIPLYKGYLKVNNIPGDTIIEINKNNSNRKEIVIEEIDSIDNNYIVNKTSLEDYLWYVKCINDTNICQQYAPIVNLYNNVILPETTTRFPITYNIGYDNSDIEVQTNNQSVAILNDTLKIIYDTVPTGEYFIIPGLESTTRSTYFNIDYIPKAHDKVTCYANITDESYTCYLFGVNNGIGSCSFVLCTRYDGNTTDSYFDRCKRMNFPSIIRNELIKIECDYTGLTYTNGYDTYNYPLEDVTPVDCTRNLYVFGCNNNGTMRESSLSTIYKFTISDENGIILNLIPVKRKVDNVLGFYDTVGNKFYTPAAGNVIEALPAKMKGGLYVSNVTEDTEVTITESIKQHSYLNADGIDANYNIEKSTLEDYWYYIHINNLTDGKISFNNQAYTNYYICNSHENIDMSVSYAGGYDSNNFIVSEGQLTNVAWKLTNVSDDKVLTIMLNDYHDPVCNTTDDLGIFTNTDFEEYNQYIIIEGTDISLTKYALINSQSSNMIQRDIYEFNTEIIDLLGWNPNNVPGEVQCRNVSPDSNIDEVITNITVDGKQLYKHVFTLRNQIRLETNKQYIFKVRNSQDQTKLIACAKDTTSRNLVNSNNEMYILDDKLYFGWNDANKYIVTGNMSIYFEINGVKQ